MKTDVSLYQKLKTMTTKATVSTSTPWTVLRVEGDNLRIVRRFKTLWDAVSYSTILHQNQPDTVFEVRFLSSRLPNDAN